MKFCVEILYKTLSLKREFYVSRLSDWYTRIYLMALMCKPMSLISWRIWVKVGMEHIHMVQLWMLPAPNLAATRTELLQFTARTGV
jgi:hypothetical protein